MTSAYRTVSEPAVMMIAGVIPVALLAKERKAIYRRKGENLREVVAREVRQRTLSEWQLSWQNESKGKWTARLIDKLDPWLNRKHDEIDVLIPLSVTFAIQRVFYRKPIDYLLHKSAL